MSSAQIQDTCPCGVVSVCNCHLRQAQEVERLKAERDRYRELWLAAYRREVARAR